ncbi:hypothetical protein [Nocardia sp. CA-135398]|uniref:hypothetical protein n=1 Tax=Nocardia sp. CA-135398 TaxID=3239977 RepID=UPI003D96C6B5
MRFSRIDAEGEQLAVEIIAPRPPERITGSDPRLVSGCHRSTGELRAMRIVLLD